MVAARAPVNRRATGPFPTADTSVADLPNIHRRTTSRFALPLVALSLACAIAASCAPERALTGNLPRPEKLAQVKPGFTTQNEVRELLGPPSNVGTFNSKVWYYISQTTEDVPMNVPQVRDRNVLVIRFDDDGVVEKMQDVEKT